MAAYRMLLVNAKGLRPELESRRLVLPESSTSPAPKTALEHAK